jgi:Ca-activated chloride channel family protein
MFKSFLFLIFSLPIFVHAQLQADKTVHDFGNITYFNNDTAYFTFSNTGGKNVYLLSTQPKDNYAVLCSSKTIAPGSIMLIGIVYYTDKKGSFNQDIQLYFSNSNTPTVLKIKGNIKSIRETAFSICPSIENSRPIKNDQIPLSITVRDVNTSEIIKIAQVKVQRNYIDYSCVPGFESWNYKCKVDYGIVSVLASKKGYASNAIDFNYSEKNHDCVIFLTPIIDSTEKKPVLIPDKKPVLITEKKHVEKHKDKDSLIVPETPAYVPVAYKDSGFNSFKYKPNHLIFIVDISGSMRDSGKLNYLKKSIKELTSVIRPGDFITLITYTNKVRVVFENLSGLDRRAIDRAIDTLKAGGGSNGSQSLVIAYEIARKYFIQNGNNQVFIATDGLLNSSKMSNEDLYKLASKAYRQDKVILSSIGFGQDLKAIEFLQKLAKHGHGNFIRINNPDTDMKNLIEEVKMQCKI